MGKMISANNRPWQSSWIHIIGESHAYCHRESLDMYTYQDLMNFCQHYRRYSAKISQQLKGCGGHL